MPAGAARGQRTPSGGLAAERRLQPVVQRGLDEQPARGVEPALVSVPSRRVWPELCS